MTSTIDTVQNYVTGTIVTPIFSRYALGAKQSPDWLPEDYIFVAEKLDLAAGPAVDYGLDQLMVGKVPGASTNAQRLFQTYTDTNPKSTLDGWLSIDDPWFKNLDITIPNGVLLGYTVCLNKDLEGLWPETEDDLEDITIVLLKDGAPVSAGKYVVNIDGLWWISDQYDDLPLSIYVGDNSHYSISITKTATAENQLNGVEVVDTTLINPVVGTDDLALNILDKGADQCDAVPRVITLYAGQESKIKLSPADTNGTPVAFEDDTVVVPVFTIRSDRDSRNLIDNYTCEESDDGGTFTVTLRVTTPGVYIAQLLLFNTTQTNLLYCTDYYMSVLPSGTYGGAVSVPEVRLHMMDTCAEKNELIDAFEFSDADIINATMNCIEFFNGAMGSSPSTARYSSSNFPSDGRYFLKQGISASLLRSKAILMARNSIHYNAGGVSIDDQGKHTLYLAMAKEFDADWRQYVGRKHSYRSFRNSFVTVN